MKWLTLPPWMLLPWGTSPRAVKLCHPQGVYSHKVCDWAPLFSLLPVCSPEFGRSGRQARESLKWFQLGDIVDTGEVVGNGSYAKVTALNFRGLKCVGKKIHELLYQMATEQEKAEMLRRFASECELLSRLHHPCIVQFLGVFFEPGSQLPVMVMEYLHTTLASCLERYGVLPSEINYGILREVALGLRYLHESSPSIVHRDLSANNVLLATDMSAKISDLGVAKILNISPAQMTQQISTQVPGTPCYMPPEALTTTCSYTSKIDSYSFGVLVIHVLCGRWPFPSEAFREQPGGLHLPILEFERRAEYIQEIGQDHPLMGLIRQCLSNVPASRPKAADILQQVEVVASQVPPSFPNKVEMMRQLEIGRRGANAGGRHNGALSTTCEVSQGCLWGGGLCPTQ